ncbi:dimethylarginine dimethylaminohydrolase family protein [Rossellomorea arthrocnemi]|jgi:N-dimethylarginine dimethylaminohydrolase|uniref:dimethylarginine dimethylaminohydrolase family protein n=1 Tax=Rossellomorea arthrocnemi TaxID=2769542 RepID=UPI00191A0816|nr:arginine deiminase family protein [Rossellomorea arthrocnemi]
MSLNSPMVPNSKTYCSNEYGKLKKVVVVSPENMQINEIINETQKHFLDDNINIDKAVLQHEKFVDTLEKNGAEVIHLQPSLEFNEQVFTRDIGFTIHDQFFVSSMNTDVRRGEVETLKKWLDENGVPYSEFLHSIEGGDVLVDGDDIWIGVSGRTNQLAIQSLRNQLTPYTVHELPLREDILHLDCVFTIISSEWAIVYPPAFSKEDLKTIKSHYNIITVTDKEQFQMGPNVLAIGDEKIISLIQHTSLNKRMKAKGFEVIELDLSEIIKSGGSFRCCTLPLIRE